MAKPTAAQKRYFTRVAELGCMICKAPAEIHHRTGAGMGQKSDNKDVMPLCPDHHRLGMNDKLAIHNGVETWEAKHGTQDYWIQWTQDQIFQHSLLT